MIIYSVTVNVEDDIHEDWLKWMKEVHIQDVMNTGFFVDQMMSRIISHNPEESGTTYNIQYQCESMKKLHEYQTKCASKLQKEHTERYEGKFVAFRTLLEKIS